MMSLNAILKEIRGIPGNRLEDLYSFVHSLNTKIKNTDTTRKMILAFAGSFSDLSEKEYNEYLKKTKSIRKKLFARKVDL